MHYIWTFQEKIPNRFKILLTNKSNFPICWQSTILVYFQTSRPRFLCQRCWTLLFWSPFPNSLDIFRFIPKLIQISAIFCRWILYNKYFVMKTTGSKIDLSYWVRSLGYRRNHRAALWAQKDAKKLTHARLRLSQKKLTCCALVLP